MTDISAGSAIRTRHRVGKAVYQHAALSRDGISERLFALLFSGLVYPQIWEDPAVDMEGLELAEGHRLVTIASGGCNVLAYLTASPARIDAVDLNATHVALLRLKLAAGRHLPGQGDFHRFFSASGFRHNSHAYDRFVAPHLDARSRAFWEGRDMLGRRRITVFDRDIYRTGLLGLCIAMGHRVARLHGVDPSGLMGATNIGEQRRFYREQLAPLFERPLIRFATRSKASLFGLGIPPAQYDALAGERSMADVLSERLEKLACHFPLADNYFAWQAFARRYPRAGSGPLPHYLDADHFPAIRANAERVAVHQVSFTELLANRPTGSVDRYVLLDAQDWMSDAQLNALWTEITRTAAPDARVLFRTAGPETLLPGRVSDDLLAQWTYRAEQSAELTARDRSAIYGGVHLYVRR